MNRYDPKIIAIKSLRLAQLYVPATLVYWIAALQIGPGGQVVPFRIMAAFAALQVATILGQWLSVKYEITPTGVVYSRGVLVRDKSSVLWSDVVSLQVTQPFLFKVFGCYSLSLGTGARHQSRVTFDAVSDAVVAEARALFESSRATHMAHVSGGERRARSTSRDDSGQVGARSGDVLFSARPLDYLLISLTYGQFILFAPALFGIYSDLSGGAGVASLRNMLADYRPWTPFHFVLIAVTTCCAATLYGVLRSYLSYKSFRVIKSDHGLEMVGGLSTTERRSVTAEATVGVRLSVNVLMRLFSSGKLSVISRDRGRRYASNIVLPVARYSLIETVVEEYFRSNEGVVSLIRSKPALRVSISVLAALIVGLAAVVLSVAIKGHVGLYAVPLVLLAGCVLNYGYGSFQMSRNGEAILLRRGLLWMTVFGVPVEDIYSVSFTQVPFGRSRSWNVASLTFFDGSRRRVLLAGVTRQDCTFLGSLLSAERTPTGSVGCHAPRVSTAASPH